MHCPDCGKINPAGSIYCNSCGKKLPTMIMDTTVKCPFCGAPGQEFLFNCSKCGKELPRDSSGRPLSRESGKGMRFCNGCGKELGPAVDVCPYCGTKRIDPWSSSITTESSYLEDGSDLTGSVRPESSTPIIAGILLVLAGLLALGQGLIYLLANSIAESTYGYSFGNLCFCGGLDVVFGICAIVGAISCFGRKNFMFALLGGILGMLGIGFLIGALFGLIGLILVAIAKDEFED